MKKILIITIVFLGAAFLPISADAQIAGGGNYTLTQTAIANGGASGNGASVGGNYTVEGTIGQSAAGTDQHNVSYDFQAGFWTRQPFAPTAANVSVSGRVITAKGNGIRNVRIILTNSNGEIRYNTTSSFGYFRFDNVPSGETYIISVSAKKYNFAQPVQVFAVFEDVANIIFTANE